MKRDNSLSREPSDLGELERELEREVMQRVWARGTITAEQTREDLTRPLKESTVRTVLRRLEEKGYVTHTVEGRTYHFAPTQSRGAVAAKAVQHIVDLFCNGSVEEALIAMVDNSAVKAKRLSSSFGQDCQGEKK